MITCRLLGFEGNTDAEWQWHDELRTVLLRPIPINLKPFDDPYEPTIRVARYDLYGTMGPADGGPLAIYRRVK